MSAVLNQIADWRLVRGVREAGTAAIERLEQFLALKMAWNCAAVGLLVLQTGLIFSHQPWLDEWQALQLALQSPTIAGLLENLRYEGHPPLWYLLLRGIGFWVDPFWVLPVAASLIALPAQAAILSKSPFSRAERLMISSGCFMLFEFMTISRSMTLGVALLIATMVLWRTRWVWLAIALLPLCDFLFGALSGILVLLQWRDRKGPWWPGIVLWGALGAVSAWSVRPAPDMLQALELLGPMRDLSSYMTRIGVLLLPLQWDLAGPAWNGFPPLDLGVLLGGGFFLFAWRQTRADPFQALLFWGFVALTLIFSMVIYPLHARHLMLIALLLILFVWRQAADGRLPSRGFRLWLLTGSLCGLLVATVNFVVPFDTAKLAAAEIRKRGLVDKQWMVFPDSRAQGVSALTGIKFERTEKRCMQTFIRWNYRTSLLTPDRLTAFLRQETAHRGRIYLLSDLELSALPRDLVVLLARIPAGYDRQEYYLYEVGPKLPDAAVGLPDCVPNQRPLSAGPKAPQ